MSQDAIDAALRGPAADARERLIDAVYGALDRINYGLMQGDAAGAQTFRRLESMYRRLHRIRYELIQGDRQ